MKLTRLNSTDKNFDDALAELLHWNLTANDEVQKTVIAITQAVAERGDEALNEYTREIDQACFDNTADYCIGAQELKSCYEKLDREDQDALHFAVNRITEFHQKQKQDSWDYLDEFGNRLGQRVTPIERVGIYVPGGQAAYPSSLLMTAIPAKVAGVAELVVTTPAVKGKKNTNVLAAAHLCGIEEVYLHGGAQAIAALAYGTKSIGKVDKIVGPGGAYVAAAKRLVFGLVGIDSIAGPSEVCIVADEHSRADWLALDLFSQAEHDSAAQAIVICSDADNLERIAIEMQRLLPSQARREIIQKSLEQRGALIQARNLDEAMKIANRIAPEHLELAMTGADQWIDKVVHAGAIFVGQLSPEVIGDYTAGPSHVLPTFGTTRFSSPLGVYDFQKRSSVIELSSQGLQKLAPAAARLARSEGLEAHAQAAETRVK